MQFQSLYTSAGGAEAGLSVEGTSEAGTISTVLAAEGRTSSAFRVDSGARFEDVDSLGARGSAGAVESRGPV